MAEWDEAELANASAYERDFFAWTQHQAALLRAGDLAALDLDHLAEEIESVGARDYREAQSRLEILIQHLLKWRYQPELQCRSWRSSIWTQRKDLSRVLHMSPSLRARLPDFLAEAYENGREKALQGTGLYSPPSTCPFAPSQILDREWLPE